MSVRIGLYASAIALLAMPSYAAAQAIPEARIAEAEKRAEATVRAMRPEEKLVLTHGSTAMPIDIGDAALPEGVIFGAGYVSGIARLGVPMLRETDASLGVAYLHGVRHDDATAMPSGLAQASTWDPELIFRGGAAIGQEARAKGFNVMLAGGINLARDPRNGRNFEYMGEDPLLAGMLGGAQIRGVQSNHIISTVKHFALNGQETGRTYADSVIDPKAAHESDFLAFRIAIEQGSPLSVMCGYNRVNGANACDSDWLLNDVLKREWHYPGFVMSDWGAVTSVDTALHGLDQQSGAQLDPKVYLADELGAKVAASPLWRARLDDMNRRILTSIYAAGIDKDPAKPGGMIDFAAHKALARDVAAQGIVLLRNESGVLPLTSTAHRIAVIGGLANVGVLAGGGSSHVQSVDGPAATVPIDVDGNYGSEYAQIWHRSSPLAALRTALPGAQVSFRSGENIAEAVDQAKKAEVAIIFATKWAGEGRDAADLTLPGGQDALIAAVAAANPHTVVVLETGNPVTMPWLSSTAAVLEAWFPGAAGGEAIADVLLGKVNPSGRLPMTFPTGLDQLPRAVIDGFFETQPDFVGAPPTPNARIMADYRIEGADVGYRWFARRQHKPLFPFGFGLSYTRFSEDGLTVDGVGAQVRVRNEGARAGAEVVQLYLVSRAGAPLRRLVAFDKVMLAPGAAAMTRLAIDPRLLADWDKGCWAIPAGDYGFALGRDAQDLGPVVTVHMAGQRFGQAGKRSRCR